MAHKPTDKAIVTCKFGTKNHGKIVWQAGWHTGTDYAAAYGDNIYAVEDGEIVHVGRFHGWGNAYGIHVIIKSGKYQIAYCHLSELNLKVVQKKHIKAGEIIGYAGASGTTNGGVHLHLEVREAPFLYANKVIDPETLFKPTKPPVKPKPKGAGE